MLFFLLTLYKCVWMCVCVDVCACACELTKLRMCSTYRTAGGIGAVLALNRGSKGSRWALEPSRTILLMAWGNQAHNEGCRGSKTKTKNKKGEGYNRGGWQAICQIVHAAVAVHKTAYSAGVNSRLAWVLIARALGAGGGRCHSTCTAVECALPTKRSKRKSE